MKFIVKLINVNCTETESFLSYHWLTKSYQSPGQTSDVPQVLQKGLKVRKQTILRAKFQKLKQRLENKRHEQN